MNRSPTPYSAYARGSRLRRCPMRAFSPWVAAVRWVRGAALRPRSPVRPPMRSGLASDHAAVDLKAALREWLIHEGHEVADLGPDSHDSVDYPDYGYSLADVVADGTAERGV